jgi:hypothetical protein
MAFNDLPLHIQRKARESYRLWKEDPFNPGLQFKQIHPIKPIFSVRIGIGWRAVGVKEGETIIWYWIGSHGDYDRLIANLS